jgi:hypothetical protein
LPETLTVWESIPAEQVYVSPPPQTPSRDVLVCVGMGGEPRIEIDWSAESEEYVAVAWIALTGVLKETGEADPLMLARTLRAWREDWRKP